MQKIYLKKILKWYKTLILKSYKAEIIGLKDRS